MTTESYPYSTAHPHTIAMIGPHGCGKTHIAMHLAEKYGYKDLDFISALRVRTRLLQSLDPEYPRIVVDHGLIYRVEYEAVKSIPNAKVWRILWPPAHASEGQLDDVPVDAEIVNDGSIPELLAKVDRLMEAVE